VDYRVTNDGHGNLAGYAWAENVGWISFSCENTSSCGTVSYGVTIDVSSGDFSGQAWGENVGWITFASNGPHPYKVKTDWCQSTVAAPLGTPVTYVTESGELSWPPLGDADWYEVVQGDLVVLRGSGGDFSAATTDCTGDNLFVTTVPLLGDLLPGEGIWYLVRGANCKGKGTFDSGGPTQVGLRDAEIAVTGNDCP
jgi:hypothetical protein